MTCERPAAVLFDMDGLLVDSEPLWFEVEREVFARIGGRRAWRDEEAAQMVGRSLASSAQTMLDAASASMPAGQRPTMVRDDVVGMFVASMSRRLSAGVPWQPGSLELLERLRAADVPRALVSSSYRAIVDVVVSQLPSETFAATVAGDEVTAPKPAPEPYLEAARLLDVDPRRCVVLEDSVTGARAGDAAGCSVLLIPDRGRVPDSLPWRRHPALTHLTLADLTTS